jgi:hypothetical protein
MWSNERYRHFLLHAKPGRLTEEWFRWFTGAWNVARTIKDGKQRLVREYLDLDFRKELLEGGGAEVVDAAAEYIQKQGWSSQKRKNGHGSLPISLVSKVGFFLCPNKLVPLDRYALHGLNGLRRAADARVLNGKSYHIYLEAFNEEYARIEPLLAATLAEPWAITLAQNLGCPSSVLPTIAMRRKLFDDYLMHSGNYLR